MTDETRESIGTVWHTTEKGKDIVSMHDYQYRAMLAAVAERNEAIRVLAKFIVYRIPTSALEANPIARAAVDAAKGGEKA